MILHNIMRYVHYILALDNILLYYVIPSYQNNKIKYLIHVDVYLLENICEPIHTILARRGKGVSYD
jgi:hypothetical protein